MSYNTYYLRCVPADYDEMIALGVSLGVIKLHAEDGETSIYAPDGAWDFIGEIQEPTGAVVTTEEGDIPVMAPITDEHGTPYLHANLRTKIDLYQRAQELAAEHPEIAAGLQDMGRFFLLDENGRAKAPGQPHRIFL